MKPMAKRPRVFYPGPTFRERRACRQQGPTFTNIFRMQGEIIRLLVRYTELGEATLALPDKIQARVQALLGPSDEKYRDALAAQQAPRLRIIEQDPPA